MKSLIPYGNNWMEARNSKFLILLTINWTHSAYHLMLHSNVLF